jgi:ankyrin repeat protein
MTNRHADYNERGRTRERSEDADRQVLVAARDGSTSRIRNLFEEKDAHGWYQDENGMTALHYACASDRDDVEILEVLLGKGCADVNALNRAGESPLRLAINRKGAFSATARYLRDSGGKDLGPKPRQALPIRLTARTNHTSLSEQERRIREARNSRGMTILHHTCNSGPDDVEKVELLLDRFHADIDGRSNTGASPLHLAIESKGKFSATAKFLRGRGGKDLGPDDRSFEEKALEMEISEAQTFSSNVTSRVHAIIDDSWEESLLLFEDMFSNHRK